MRLKITITAIVLILWIGFFVYQIWFNPQIEFLPPCLKAQWVLHPEQNVLHFQHGPPSEDVIFKLSFDLKPPIPERALMKIKAMTIYSLKINNRPVGHSRPGHNWKRFDRYDIRPFLSPGRNELVVRVSNPTGFPILLVEGKVGKAIPLNTSPESGWMASKPGRKEWVGCVPAIYRRPEPLKPKMALLLFGYLGVILFLFLPKRLGSVDIEGEIPAPLYWSAVGGILFALILLNLHNAHVYPYKRGIDSSGHVEYIEHFTHSARVPLAFEGWEMFQPPFYYVLASLIYRASGSLKSAQYLTAVFGTFNVVLAFLMLRLILPERRELHLAGLTLAAFMPMQIYMNPLITNEVPAATVISLSLYLGLRWLRREKVGWLRFALLGASLSLALLTKYTALFVLITLTAVYLLRWVREGKEFAGVVLMLLIVIASAGWFYARNLVIFGDPLVGNWDEQSTFHYEQNPGYRTLSFYLKFGSALYSKNIENHRWTSFWDGEYGSMWGEDHFFVARMDDKLQMNLMRWTLFLALMPSIAMMAGALRSVRKAFFGNDLYAFALLLLTFLSLSSAVNFSMEIPFFSTVKAFFLLSLLGPFVVFACEGFDMIRPGRMRWIAYVVTAVIAIMAYVTYYLR
ncbi:glycosyltransferase family 39 protein [Candidatus Poribacteria bacterium]|nr:glycosyltransferase family 39 protein [Candidatus Poribacteria bacterium]